MMRNTLFLGAKTLAISVLILAQAQAAIPPKEKWLIGQGSQIGGTAGSGFTLLDLRLTQDKKKKIERIVMDMGDRAGAPLKGVPGYFHVELQPKPHRIVIDLAQTPSARIDEKKLAEIFKKSIWVQKTAMTVDPADNTLNIALNLKANAKVRVLQVPGQKQPSKIVLDIVTE